MSIRLLGHNESPAWAFQAARSRYMHSLAWVIVLFLLQSLMLPLLPAEFQTTAHLFPTPPPTPLMMSALLQQSDMWLPFLVLCSRSCTQPLVCGVNSLSHGFLIVIQKMYQGQWLSLEMYTHILSPSYGFLTIGRAAQTTNTGLYSFPPLRFNHI